MTKIERLRTVGAGPYDELDLDFRAQGLVRLKGKNGMGKSTVFHLLTQALFGQNPNKAKKSDLVQKGEFLIEVTFSREGARYVAAQAVKSKQKNPLGKPYGSGVYFYRSDEQGTQELTQHKDLDTQKVIRETLGWSIEEWYGYVYLSQQSTHTLINGTPSERYDYLSKLFGLEGLDRVAAHYKKKASDLEAEVQETARLKEQLGVRQSLLAAQDSLETIEAKLRTSEVELADLTQYRGACQAKQAAFERSEQLRARIEGFSPEALRDSEQSLEAQQLQRAQYQADQTTRRENKARAETLHQALSREVPAPSDDSVLGAADLDLPEVLREITRLAALFPVEPSEPVEVPTDLEQVLGAPVRDEAWVKGQIERAERTIREAPVDPGPEPEDFQQVMSSPDVSETQTLELIRQIKARLPDPGPLDASRQQQAQEELNQTNQRITLLQDRLECLSGDQAECQACGTALPQQTKEEKLEQTLGEIKRLKKIQAALKVETEEMARHREAVIRYEAQGPDRTQEIPEMEKSLERYRKKQQYRDYALAAQRFKAAQEARTELEARQADLREIEKRSRYGVIRTRHQQYLRYQESLEAQARHRDLRDKAEQYRAKQRYLEWQAQQGELRRFREELTAIESQLATPEVSFDLSAFQTLETLTAKLREQAGWAKEHQELGAVADQSKTLARLDQEIEQCQRELGALRATFQSNQSLQEEIAELQSKVAVGEETYRRQSTYAGIAKHYGKAGSIRERILSRFSEYLESALLTHTVGPLPTHRFQIGVDEGVDISASKSEGPPYDVKFMSGAEKGALSLAFLFALDDILPPHKRTSLKILDEIESAFDRDRKHDFIEQTLPRLKERAETIVVVSHSEEVAAGAFDRIWEVTQKGVADVTNDVRN